ncbi:MAG TPA: hypothetical protein VH912_22725 [Streptosporangiaceae bacterium]
MVDDHGFAAADVVVVVGAGSAGCVPAAALSRDSACELVLVEEPPGVEDRKQFRLRSHPIL